MIPRLRARTFALLLLLVCPAPARAATNDAVPGELLVRYRPSVRSVERAATRQNQSLSAIRHVGFLNLDLVRVSGTTVADAIERLRSDPNVLYAEPNYYVHATVVPNDPRFPELYGLNNTGQGGGLPGADIRAPRAWDLFTGDPELKIGVIDTGLDYTHPDLAENVWTNPGEIPGNGVDDDGNGYTDDVHGYDFVAFDGNPFDENGHGTHVAGTIAAIGNNGLGVTGVCWRAKIVPIRFLDSRGAGSTANAVLAMEYAIRVGCRVTNNSWGGGAYSQAMVDAINVAGADGQLFVAAAGNSGVNTDITPEYPGAYDSPYILSVAATDFNDRIAPFSNWGPQSVDLAAPGVNILSLWPGGGYQQLSGTSMATPHVTGAVALAMGRFPEASNLLIRSLILGGTDRLTNLNGRTKTGGRLNAFLAVSEVDSLPPGGVTDLVVLDRSSNAIRIGWTAPGDDGGNGRATRYEVRYSSAPILDLAAFTAATPIEGPDPKSAGAAESTEVRGLAFSSTHWFAVRAADEFGNRGPISNTVSGTTLGTPDADVVAADYSAELLVGAHTERALTLRNVGEGTLDFTVPAPEIAFSQPAVYEYRPVPKGQEGPPGAPVTQGRGGPDGFGYRWMDSREPECPPFDWVDIRSTGTLIQIQGDEATSIPLQTGFPFPFYGSTFTTFRVNVNGFLTFGEAFSAFDNQPLPNPGAPGYLVAPMWDDLILGINAYVWVRREPGRCIVMWQDAAHNPSGGPYTFEAILYPTGEIHFQYLDVNDPKSTATIGIQNGTRTVGLTVAHDTAFLRDSLRVRILPVTQWVTVSPSSGRLYAGQQQDLAVRFDALGMDGGLYDGAIHVLTNDPDESHFEFPAHLRVIGAPDLAVSPASVDFGSFFLGLTATRSITLTNPGTERLVVSDLRSSDPEVTPEVSALTLAPRDVRQVALRFTPGSVRTLSATLTIRSDDPDRPELVLPLSGMALPPPAIRIDPESLAVELPTNALSTAVVRITNTGGNPYTFTAKSERAHAVAAAALDRAVSPGATGGGPAAFGAGGPDDFGHTWRDSDEPGGPVFDWHDIRGSGHLIEMTGDDSNTGPYPIGFEFPFYGSTFTSFRITTNGWISFTNGSAGRSNFALPSLNPSAPENVVAPFWDDLAFATTRRAYYYNDGTRLIVQWHEVRRFGETDAFGNTFQAILYPNGTIVFQYFSMKAVVKNSATVGIQNATKDDGLTVVYNADYVHDGLAVRISPPPNFLTVSPPAGTVPPGGTVDLTLGFNASGLFGGDYRSQVRLDGNDPVLPVAKVPVGLHVLGVPDLAAQPGALDFGSVFVGWPLVRELRLVNMGSDPLVITDLRSDDPSFGADRTTFTVPPLGTALALVSFGPGEARSYDATLTVESNDPDHPQTTVALAGLALVAPDLDPDPLALAAEVSIPESAHRTLRLRNPGGSELQFRIGALFGDAEVQTFEALELRKDELDPRPGLLGRGGPDATGYTWRDSDDAGGPVFDWVDLTTGGTTILLTGSGDDNNVAAIPIGFSFPFYGNHYSAVNVSVNGWLSFTSRIDGYTNNPLPNVGSGVPENLLAAFWDDLLAGISVPRLFYRSEPGRFVMEYSGILRKGSGGPYTFEVILYPDGRIRYQYLSMNGSRLNEATIGIQNGDRTDGLTAAFNAPYVHDRLAIEFRSAPEFVRVTPDEGTIPAGGALDLDVEFRSAGLFGGVHAGALRILSNDPDEGRVTLPAVLTAHGVPDVAAAPAAVDHGVVYVGRSDDRTIVVSNEGTDALRLSAARFDSPQWTLVAPASFPIELARETTVSLIARFTPIAACAPCTATLTIESDDPDEPALAVALSGTGLVPPEIAGVPVAIRSARARGLGAAAERGTRTVVIRNRGGSDLAWSAESFSSLPAIVQEVEREQVKGAEPEPGMPVVRGVGGPDRGGYRWMDSDEEFGPSFSWVDISANATEIPFMDDDENLGPFPIHFAFPFYGKTFTSFRVCSNGWLSFTSTKTTFINTRLPSTLAVSPENIVAPFWHDITFANSGGGRVYYESTAERVVVTFDHVRRYGGGGPYTFQVILYPTGSIDFQYLVMTPGYTFQTTVGIQNSTRDAGTQVVFNQEYVKAGLCTRLAPRTGWLSVVPASGVVAVGARDTVSVSFDASAISNGDYDGLVRFHTNDLDEADVDVPCAMHVGTLPVRFDLDAHALNRSAHGRWVEGEIEVPDGYDARRIVRSSVLVQGRVPAAWPHGHHDGHDRDAAAPAADEAGVPAQEAAAGTTLADSRGPGAMRLADEDLLLDEESDAPELDDEGGAPGDEVSHGWHRRHRAEFFFSRDSLRAVLPTGDSVAVEVTGEIKDVTWFSGRDTIRVVPPDVRRSPPLAARPTSGPEDVALTWSDGGSTPATSYELWYSPDRGESWQPVFEGLTSRSLRWIPPATESGAGLIELVALDAGGPIGSWQDRVAPASETPPAAVTSAPLPAGFAFARTGANPARGEAGFQLAMPAAGRARIEVFDVRGRLVRRIADREFEAGLHAVRWDGRDAGGSAAGAGLYFVRGETPGARPVVLRLTLLR